MSSYKRGFKLNTLPFSETSFEKRPLLAHAIHHSMCQPLFYVASKIQKTAYEVLKEYAFADANQGRCSTPFYNAIEGHINETVSSQFTTQFSPNAAAVHLHSHSKVDKALDTNRLQNVVVKKEDVGSLCELFGRLQIQSVTHPHAHTLQETTADPFV